MSSRTARPSKIHYESSASASSVDSSSSDSDLSIRQSMEARPVTVEVLRCMRCARSVEMTSTDDITTSGMVAVGTNIYYCKRCAKMTGYN